MVNLPGFVFIIIVCMSTSVDGSKYVLVDEMATWYDAKSKCEKYGLGFAKVTSQSDQELIQKIQLKNQG
ncbi:hypothetical protein Btru_027864, partial [Bulinus truncatus]